MTNEHIKMIENFLLKERDGVEKVRKHNGAVEPGGEGFHAFRRVKKENVCEAVGCSNPKFFLCLCEDHARLMFEHNVLWGGTFEAAESTTVENVQQRRKRKAARLLEMLLLAVDVMEDEP